MGDLMIAPIIRHRTLCLRGGFEDECKLSLAVAGGCLVAGACDFIANRVAPGSTSLDGMLIVGVFYLVLGMASYCKSSRLILRNSEMSTIKTMTRKRRLVAGRLH